MSYAENGFRKYLTVQKLQEADRRTDEHTHSHKGVSPLKINNNY
jgi:hypothetical protein